MQNDEINLYDQRDVVVATVTLPRRHPSTKIISWQQRLFLKDSMSGLYYEEVYFLAPIVSDNNKVREGANL